MVGYRQEDTLTPDKKIIAGCIAGVVTRFLSQPLDVLKIRTQLQRRKSSTKRLTIFETSKKILYEEGLFAFWHGHNLGQMHSILSTTSQFYIYEITTQYVFSSPVNPKYKAILELMCGICAGSCNATLVTPLEVIRVRQMLVKDQYKGFINGARAVYKSGGFFAFFEGWAAGVLMLGPQVGITFSVFSFMQPLLLDYMHSCNENCEHAKANAHEPQHLLLATTIASSIAGCVSKIMCYPMDLAKRRMQIASHQDNKQFYTPSTSKNLVKCSKLIQCLRETIKMDGFLGLYRGLTITVYKAQLNTVLMFTTYEFVCYFIRGM